MPLLPRSKRSLVGSQQGQSGQRLNLDGGSFHAGGVFELFHKGGSRRRQIERGTGASTSFSAKMNWPAGQWRASDFWRAAEGAWGPNKVTRACRASFSEIEIPQNALLAPSSRLVGSPPSKTSSLSASSIWRSSTTMASLS